MQKNDPFQFLPISHDEIVEKFENIEINCNLQTFFSFFSQNDFENYLEAYAKTLGDKIKIQKADELKKDSKIQYMFYVKNLSTYLFNYDIFFDLKIRKEDKSEKVLRITHRIVAKSSLFITGSNYTILCFKNGDNKINITLKQKCDVLKGGKIRSIKKITKEKTLENIKEVWNNFHTKLQEKIESIPPHEVKSNQSTNGEEFYSLILKETCDSKEIPENSKNESDIDPLINIDDIKSEETIEGSDSKDHTASIESSSLFISILTTVFSTSYLLIYCRIVKVQLLFLPIIFAIIWKKE